MREMSCPNNSRLDKASAAGRRSPRILIVDDHLLVRDERRDRVVIMPTSAANEGRVRGRAKLRVKCFFDKAADFDKAIQVLNTLPIR